MNRFAPFDLFEIGPPKTGSTIIQKCLEEHPEVWMYDNEFSFLENPDYTPNVVEDLMEKKFKPNKEKNRITAAKRATALCRSEIPERLYNLNPNIKIISVLRNPIERAISAYFYYIKTGFLPVIPIEKGLNDLLNNNTIQQDYKRSYEILEYGFYHKYLSNYLKHFELNKNLFIFFFEDFQKSPLQFIQNIYKTVGINANYTPVSLNNNAQPSLYSLPRLKFNNLGNNLRYTYNDEKNRLYPKRETTIIKFSLRWLEFVDSRILSTLYPNKKPKLPPLLKSELLKFYKDDCEQLEILLKKDLSQWKV